MRIEGHERELKRLKNNAGRRRNLNEKNKHRGYPRRKKNA